MTPDTRDLKLKVLQRICEIIAKAPDLENTLMEVLAILSDRLSMKRGTVALFDRGTDRLFICASHGLSPEEEHRGIHRLDEGVTGRIFLTGRPFAVPGIRNKPMFLDKTRSRTLEKDHLTFLGVPIMQQGAPIGLLAVDRLFENAISCQEDIDFLQLVAVLVGQFIKIHEQFQDLRNENASLRSRARKGRDGPYIVGKSLAMQEVQRRIERVAPTRAVVLLQGEPGTGKSLAGRIIHELSDRKRYPFVKVNCASTPESLLESELFGCENGPFAGAAASNPGKFEEADKGTIFLDEIGELPLGLQAKVVRFLQEKEFERPGGNKTRRADVRILSSTNQDLRILGEAGKFRSDLYDRLNVFPIVVPPLRERKEDIEALLLHFLRKASREYRRELRFSMESLELFKRYDWPGNVREMENLIERLAIMSEGGLIHGRLLRPHLAPRPLRDDRGRQGGRNAKEPSSLKDLEKREIIAALERNGWIQSRAARDLGLSQRQVGYKIAKYGLESLIARQRTTSKSPPAIAPA